MKNEVEKITEHGYTLRIFYDEFAPNPRKEFSNIGKFYTRPSRDYNYGDDDASAEDAKAAPVCLPVSVYDHSGVRVYVGGRCDAWDSTTIGCIYVTKKALLEEYKNYPREKALELAESSIRGEIEEYNQYLNGDVYGYTITDDRTGDEIDACWGFFGDAGRENIKAEFASYTQWQIKQDNPLFVAAGLDAWTGRAVNE